VLRFNCSLPDDLRAALHELVAAQRTLEHVVRWGLADSPPRLVADVVKQDEFTLDVVMPYRGHFVVYDAT
jgi:hypothetical protein